MASRMMARPLLSPQRRQQQGRVKAATGRGQAYAVIAALNLGVGVEPEVDFLAKARRGARGQVGMGDAGQMRCGVHTGYAYAQSGQRQAHFQPNGAQAQHGNGRRQRGQVKECVGGDDVLAHGIKKIGQHRLRAGRNDDGARLESERLVLLLDLHARGLNKAGLAQDELVPGSAAGVSGRVLGKAVAQLVCAGPFILCAAGRCAIASGLPTRPSLQCRFGRHAAHACAGAAQRAVIDDAKVQSGALDRAHGGAAGGTSANNQNVGVQVLSHGFLSFLGCGAAAPACDAVPKCLGT